ncbi:MAG: 6-phosphofructokinase [Candidatus Neomarinimicrobiota bacterium]|nr:MAG: 6-phosphofructokinase [Candidatus Neomarinimicrobiota bacterium]
MVETSKTNVKGTLGILVGGGPAPGLNGVISAVTIEARRRGLKIYGIYDGYKWLVKGDKKELMNHVRELRIRDVSRIHFDGGSILRLSRTNPLKVENGVENAVKMLLKLGIQYMVTVGGDDTAYGAYEIANAAKGKIKFAHVPKTIDNDLPLPDNLTTFGFQTARDLGAVLVKNLMEDSRTTNRWYIVVTMGRYTGHLALGIAKSAAATLAIIPEEFETGEHISIHHVCDILETSILKRRAMGHRYGVLVIAEGIAERLSEEELQKIPGVSIEYDSYGHLKLSEIELGKVIKEEIENRFAKRGDKAELVELNIGYVLRCADPIPFDQEYTRDLGYNAVEYLLSDDPQYQSNAMIVVDNGKLRPLPFDKLIDPRTKKTAVRFVDIKSESYKVARSYMVRLEKRDFEDRDLLHKMAEAAKMTEKEFVDRYGYLV